MYVYMMILVSKYILLKLYECMRKKKSVIVEEIYYFFVI
jgi:hypothetical protein